MVQVQGVFAELDKSMLVIKLRKARAAKRAKAGLVAMIHASK